MAGGTAASLRLAVCGLHMQGRPLNQQLSDLGATFVKACKSARTYRLFALTDSATGVVKPGMVRVTDGGYAVALEVFDVPLSGIGQLLTQIPPLLGSGTVALEVGSHVKDLTCEGHIVACVDVDSCDMHLISSRAIACLQIPPPLGLGTVELEGGAHVKGFICEGHVAQGGPGIQDISEYGGFYQWLERDTPR